MMIFLFILLYNALFLSYFLLEMHSNSKYTQVKNVKRVNSSEKIIRNVSRNFNIQHDEQNEKKKIAQLVKKRLNELYKK